MLHSSTSSMVVAKYEEYRILAYDLQQGKYRFIESLDRHNIYWAEYSGRKLALKRFALFWAYVFPKLTTYPDYEEYGKALSWTRDGVALESRPIPNEWQSFMPRPFISKTDAIEQMARWKMQEVDDQYAEEYARWNYWKEDPDELEYRI